MPLVPVVIQPDPRGERSFDIYSRMLHLGGQRGALALDPAGEDQRAHRHRHAAARRRHVGLDEAQPHPHPPAERRLTGPVDRHRDPRQGVARDPPPDGEIYAEHAGRTPEQVSADLERDRFFTPEEAREYGMIDLVTPLRNGNGGPVT